MDRLANVARGGVGAVTADEADKLLLILTTAYPRAREANDATIALYRRHLQGLHPDDGLVAVDALVRRSRTWPSVAELVSEADAAAKERVATLALPEPDYGANGRRISAAHREQYARLIRGLCDGTIAGADYARGCQRIAGEMSLPRAEVDAWDERIAEWEREPAPKGNLAPKLRVLRPEPRGGAA